MRIILTKNNKIIVCVGLRKIAAIWKAVVRIMRSEVRRFLCARFWKVPTEVIDEQ